MSLSAKPCSCNGYMGTLDYKTNVISTLGASNSKLHIQVIKEIQELIDAELHPMRIWFRKKFRK